MADENQLMEQSSSISMVDYNDMCDHNEKLCLQVNLLRQMLITQQRLLSSEKRNCEALKWELNVAGVGIEEQKDIIEKVKIAIVANMGEGAAPLLLGSGSGDANSIWEDEKYFVLSMMVLSRFTDASTLISEVLPEGGSVSEKELGDIFVQMYPAVRPDYVREGLKCILENLAIPADDINDEAMSLLWTAMGRQVCDDGKLQQIVQKVHDVDPKLVVLPEEITKLEDRIKMLETENVRLQTLNPQTTKDVTAVALSGGDLGSLTNATDEDMGVEEEKGDQVSPTDPGDVGEGKPVNGETETGTGAAKPTTKQNIPCQGSCAIS